MDYLLVPLCIVALWILFWLLYYVAARNNIRRSTTGFPSRRELVSESDIDKQQLIEKIKLLYLHKVISNIYVGEGYIRFEDSCPYRCKWNVYHIDFSAPSVLRYRGFMFQYRFNLSNLEGIAFYLSD